MGRVGTGPIGRTWGAGTDQEVVDAVQERAVKRQHYEEECDRGRDCNVLKGNWKEAERKVESKLRSREREKIERSVKKMEAGFKGDKAEMYSEFRDRMRGSREPMPQSLRNDRGEIRSEGAILHEWKSRFNIVDEEMGGEDDKEHRRQVEEKVEGYWKERPTSDEAERKVKWFRTKDVKEVKSKMKMKGAGGDEGVLNCMIKRGSKELNKAITLMANILASLEVVPDKWKLTVMVPAYKKGDRMSTRNYRPIGLTPVLYKVYERLLARRLKVAKIPVEQCGFRKGFGTHTVLNDYKS